MERRWCVAKHLNAKRIACGGSVPEKSCVENGKDFDVVAVAVVVTDIAVAEVVAVVAFLMTLLL